MATPNIGLPEIAQNAQQLSPQYNSAIQIIDALLPLAVQDKDLTAPPATLAGDVGKRWLPASGATGAWSGHVGEVALCVGANQWLFIEPPPYISAYVIDEDADYRNIAGTWTLIV